MTASPESTLRAVCLTLLVSFLLSPLSATAAICVPLGAESDCASGGPGCILGCTVKSPVEPPAVPSAEVTGAEPPEPPAPTDVLMGMPNPAAAYCEALGYEYEIVKDNSGEHGICLLPDGRRVNAWEFFRGKVAPEYSWCVRNGYGIATRTEDRGSFTTECAVCLSEDGTEVGTAAEMMELESGTLPALDDGHGDADGDDEGIGQRGGGDRYVPRYLGKPFGANPQSLEPPEKFDWRTLDGCTAVKDQGNCGSCWAFSTVGAFECNILIKDGVEVDLAEQYLVSCNHHSWSCGGGGFAHRYHMKTTDPCGDAGAVFENDFNYQAANVPCDCPYEHPYVLDGWGYIDPSVEVPDPELIKRAIMEFGPVSVGVMADAGFSRYQGGIFVGSVAHDINHAVVLVGWDDNQGPNGVWFLRNSWGTMWGEHGYMRIDYGSNAVGWAANWVDYRDPVEVVLPQGLPAVIEPGVPTTLTASIETTTDTYMSGTARLHYRLGDGSFQLAPMEPVGGGVLEGTLPAATCGDTPEFFFAAAGKRFGPVYNPKRAMDEVHSCIVGYAEPLFSDDFESDVGWFVEDDIDLTSGSWERGVPQGGGLRSDPPTAFGGSGNCYLTANIEGDSDVDKGATSLISPPVDLSSVEDAVVEFAYWYRNDEGDNPHQDFLRVFLSDDNGSTWARADSIGPRAPLPVAWHTRAVRVGDLVGLTDQFRVRFEASDFDAGSMVEVGIDDVTVSGLSCEPFAQSEGERTPNRFVLHPNSPNPFNPSTLIRYELPHEASVSLTVMNASGQVVRTLMNGSVLGPGPHETRWDGLDDDGREVASGAYFYILETSNEAVVRKMLLLK